MSEENNKELRFPVGKGWSLFMRDVTPNAGASVDYANDEGKFFKVDLGSVNISAQNTPDWTTVASANALEIGHNKGQYFLMHLEKGKGQYPQLIENPNQPEKKDEVAVVWSIDKVANIARVGIEEEYPVQVSVDRLFPQDRIIRRSVNNPRPNEVFDASTRPVKLASNVHLHPGLITTGVDINTIIDTTGNLSPNNIEWTQAVNTVDGIGQAALGLSIAEAAKDSQVSASISRAIVFQLEHAPKTKRPATLSQDMARVRDAGYTVTIDSKPEDEFFTTDVAGSAALSAGFYPRKGYFAPGLKVDGSLDHTLAMKVDKTTGQIYYITDNSGKLLDASEITEDQVPQTSRQTVELGRVLSNSQRIVGTIGTNVQLVEGENLQLEDLSHLVDSDNAPLMATLYRAVATAINNPLNPFAKEANEAIVSSLQNISGR